jgi:anti-anti-sigma regulatory factor
VIGDMTTTTATVASLEAPALGLELTRPARGTARLVVVGDLDLATTPALDVAVAFLCATHDEVELDLSGVAFADISAFRSLAYAGLQREGCDSVHVIASSRAVRRLVDAALATMRRAPQPRE